MQQANQNIYDKLISVFKSKKFHTDVNGDVFIEKVIDDIVHQKPELIEIILSDEVLKKAFFQEIGGALVFKPKELIEALNAEKKFLQSKTTYSQSIGLTKKDDFIVSHDDVVLAFPFKDTVFAGGQEKEDEKSKENFLHGIINANETSRLLEPKAMTNIKRYSKDGIEKNPTITDKDNLIIKGNNLLALHSLLDKADGTPLYRGKVKLIYIDPPYNTGNDGFKYNDNFSHSTWLTFMKNRLEAAREFLRDDGAIFVSIDDNEQAYLKVLMDEIFGRENFVATVVWKRKRGRDNSAKWFSKSHEYLLVFAKEKKLFETNYLELDSATKKAYTNPDNDKRGVYRMLATWARGTQGGVKYDFTNKHGQYFAERLWLFAKDNLIKMDLDNKLIIRGDNIYRKLFIYENKGKIPETIWDNMSNAANATDEIKTLFGEIVFETPKPTPYITEILKIATSKNDIVLDFHAGSGTTAHAVLDLNKEDGGNRRFILIEQMDYIEEITRKRVEKVIEKNGEGSFVYMELKKIDDFQNIAQNDDEKLNAIKMKLATEMYYLPYSEIEDATYKIPSKEKEVNHRFYGGDDE